MQLPGSMRPESEGVEAEGEEMDPGGWVPPGHDPVPPVPPFHGEPRRLGRTRFQALYHQSGSPIYTTTLSHISAATLVVQIYAMILPGTLTHYEHMIVLICY